MLTATSRQTRLIRLAESFALEAFTCTLPSGDGMAEGVAALRKDYLALVRLASSRHRTQRSDINHWRKQVSCGAVDFDAGDEEGFKESIRALIALDDILLQAFDTYAAKGFHLAKPLPVGILRSQRKAAQSMLDSWESPEWETTGRPAAAWNEEQSRHLLSRLGSPR